MKRYLFLLVVIILTCACSFSACRARAEFSGGETLSAEEAQELLASLQKGTGEETVQQDDLYYYVAGSGTVFHSDASCGYLKNSQNVQTGTFAQVQTAGKEKLCSACAKRDPGMQTVEHADGEKICFYTAGGTVWHYDAGCASLSHSKNVCEGTVTQAILAGKARPCTRCGN